MALLKIYDAEVGRACMVKISPGPESTISLSLSVDQRYRQAQPWKSSEARSCDSRHVVGSEK
jgi:hypothetical protein